MQNSTGYAHLTLKFSFRLNQKKYLHKLIVPRIVTRNLNKFLWWVPTEYEQILNHVLFCIAGDIDDWFLTM